MGPRGLSETGVGTYPIHRAEVHSFSKIEALIEAAVIRSGKGDDKLASALVGSINLGERTSVRSDLNRTEGCQESMGLQFLVITVMTLDSFTTQGQDCNWLTCQIQP